MKFFIPFFLIFFLSKSFAAMVETTSYEVTITIKSVDYGDSHDSSNEYKLDLRLQGKTGKFAGDAGPILGVLKASHSKNIYAFFSEYSRLKIGESLTRKTKVILPTSVLTDTQIKLTLLEEDFTIPVPGPCCITINDDDLELQDVVDLSLGEQELDFHGVSADVHVSVKLIDQSNKELNDVIEEQKNYLFQMNSSQIGIVNETLLYKHIIKNI